MFSFCFSSSYDEQDDDEKQMDFEYGDSDSDTLLFSNAEYKKSDRGDELYQGLQCDEFIVKADGNHSDSSSDSTPM